MSTARKVVEREPLKARPKPDANMKELREGNLQALRKDAGLSWALNRANQLRRRIGSARPADRAFW